MEKTKNTLAGIAIIVISLFIGNIILTDNQLSDYSAPEFSTLDQLKSIFSETNFPLNTHFYEKNDDSQEDYAFLEKGKLGITIHYHTRDYVRWDGYLYPSDSDRSISGGAMVFLFIAGALIIMSGIIFGIAYIRGEQNALKKWIYEL